MATGEGGGRRCWGSNNTLTLYIKSDYDYIKKNSTFSMSVANKKKSECCGCNACEEICPKHCIRMEEDAKGFLYPQIDHSVCVECGLCEKVCPFNKDNLSLHTPLTAYAAWNKNREEYLGSSSGGAAYVLSS